MLARVIKSMVFKSCSRYDNDVYMKKYKNNNGNL